MMPIGTPPVFTPPGSGGNGPPQLTPINQNLFDPNFAVRQQNQNNQFQQQLMNAQLRAQQETAAANNQNALALGGLNYAGNVANLQSNERVAGLTDATNRYGIDR